MEEMVKELIDKGTSSRPPEEAYLSYYDAPSDEVSIAGAIDLENSSWDSTERLVGDGSDGWIEDDYENVPHGAVSYDPDGFDANDTPSVRSENEVTESIDGKLINVLSAFVDGSGASFEDICRREGLFPDSAASALNDRFTDFIGDIILENVNGKYLLIDDYVEEIREFLEKERT